MVPWLCLKNNSTKKIFSLQDHRKDKNQHQLGPVDLPVSPPRPAPDIHSATADNIEPPCDTSQTIARTKISICWLYLTSQDHPRDFPWNSQHPPALRKTLPFIKVGGLKNLSVCETSIRHLGKEWTLWPNQQLFLCLQNEGKATVSMPVDVLTLPREPSHTFHLLEKYLGGLC